MFFLKNKILKCSISRINILYFYFIFNIFFIIWSYNNKFVNQKDYYRQMNFIIINHLNKKIFKKIRNIKKLQ